MARVAPEREARAWRFRAVLSALFVGYPLMHQVLLSIESTDATDWLANMTPLSNTTRVLLGHGPKPDLAPCWDRLARALAAQS